MRWISIISFIMLSLGILIFLIGIAFYVNLFFNSSTSLLTGATCTIIGILLITGAIVFMCIAKNPETDNIITTNTTNNTIITTDI